MLASVSNASNLRKNTEFIRWLIFFSIAIVCTSIDLITKYLTFEINPIDIISGVLGFKFVLNQGIIWGLFSEGSILFIIIPSLAIPLIILMFRYIHLFTAPTYQSDSQVIEDHNQSAGLNLMLTIAFGLILAGAVGNLYDRIVYKGVRDFIDFYLIHWPIFNFADIYITIGAILIIISIFRKPQTFLSPDISSEPHNINTNGTN